LPIIALHAQFGEEPALLGQGEQHALSASRTLTITLIAENRIVD
jgi:hypothetical protein